MRVDRKRAQQSLLCPSAYWKVLGMLAEMYAWCAGLTLLDGRDLNCMCSTEATATVERWIPPCTENRTWVWWPTTLLSYHTTTVTCSKTPNLQVSVFTYSREADTFQSSKLPQTRDNDVYRRLLDSHTCFVFRKSQRLIA